MTSPYAQEGFGVRLDWGPDGADAVGPGSAVVAVVDVLSFTTTLTVAVGRGIAVLPYRWRDESARRVAEEHGAALAVGRSQAGPGQVSLSPDTVARAEGIERLVLPSPNGSTVAARLAATGARVIGVSLRNAAAAAAWVRSAQLSGPVAVIAAGERWNDGPLRPAVEDLWGAGAFIAGLGGAMSPEARAALAAYTEVAGSLPTALRDCVSGRELIGNGYPADVALAGQLNADTAVPVLVDGWFVDGGSLTS